MFASLIFAFFVFSKTADAVVCDVAIAGLYDGNSKWEYTIDSSNNAVMTFKNFQGSGNTIKTQFTKTGGCWTEGEDGKSLWTRYNWMYNIDAVNFAALDLDSLTVSGADGLRNPLYTWLNGCGNTHTYTRVSQATCGSSAGDSFTSPPPSTPLSSLCSTGALGVAPYEAQAFNPIYWWSCTKPDTLDKWCSANKVSSIPISSCHVTVNPQNTKELTFVASTTGGIAPLIHNWSGAVTGTERMITKTFTESGVKTASVLVTDSYGSTSSASCSYEIAGPLSLSCKAVPSVVDLGEPITWTAESSGEYFGTFPFWSGLPPGQTYNGLNPVTVIYETAGEKNTNISALDTNFNTVSASCSAVVNFAEVVPANAQCLITSGKQTSALNEQVTMEAFSDGNMAGYSYEWTVPGKPATSGKSKIFGPVNDPAAIVGVKVKIINGSKSATVNCPDIAFVNKPSVSITPKITKEGTPCAVSWTAEGSSECRIIDDSGVQIGNSLNGYSGSGNVLAGKRVKVRCSYEVAGEAPQSLDSDYISCVKSPAVIEI